MGDWIEAHEDTFSPVWQTVEFNIELPTTEVLDGKVAIVPTPYNPVNIYGRSLPHDKYYADDIFLGYEFDRNAFDEVSYLKIPPMSENDQVPVFGAIDDVSITDVYIVPKDEVDGNTNNLVLHIRDNQNEELVASLTYGGTESTGEYQLVEFGSVDYNLMFGHTLRLEVVSGSLPDSTLVIAWSNFVGGE